MKYLAKFIIAASVIVLMVVFAKRYKVTIDRDDTGKHYMVEASAAHVNEQNQTVIYVTKPIIDEIVVPIPANDFREYVYDVVMKKDGRLQYLGVRRHSHP